MKTQDIKRYALVLAIHAEISGMKIKNRERADNDMAPAYTEEMFSQAADELRVLASKHDDEL
jgi:hypothetical protein